MRTRAAALLAVSFLCAVPSQGPAAGRDTYAKIDTISAAIVDVMRACDVPGVSVAVFSGYEVAWAKGFGVASVATREPVDPLTLFQAASISKPVAAMAVFKLVEDGRLELDAPINRYLTSWKLPDNDLAKATPVTLRRILSHTAGVSVPGFKGYVASATIPTLLQVLDGVAPANSAPVRVTMPPGTKYEYSGGAYSMMQQALVDVTGLSFPEIMRTTVLEPLGMISSTYEQPLPGVLVRHASAGHENAGVLLAGARHTFPEMAAAGLYTTPTDLARFAIEVQRVRAGQPGRVLGKPMVDLMLAPEPVEALPFGPAKLRYGHGFELYDLGDRTFFGHTGGNEGYRTWLLATPDGGNGVVVMINASAVFQDTVAPIAQIIMKTYGWW